MEIFNGVQMELTRIALYRSPTETFHDNHPLLILIGEIHTVTTTNALDDKGRWKRLTKVVMHNFDIHLVKDKYAEVRGAQIAFIAAQQAAAAATSEEPKISGPAEGEKEESV